MVGRRNARVLSVEPPGDGVVRRSFEDEFHHVIDDARRFLERCQLFALAESLGGVESLIEHPALMTHGSVPADVRAALGISDTLVRLSVGIEDPGDLIADLDAALG